VIEWNKASDPPKDRMEVLLWLSNDTWDVGNFEPRKGEWQPAYGTGEYVTHWAEISPLGDVR